ncbi:phospholipase D-like protein [Kitasatospora sp. SolWspMP-SS2h]|uniref:PLD nuclease N-terminal domain-containing protein n=1 Tax=Kitasatospora sp. SolWspMP-SS2h TaxID=1305729 RepID=UPI000DB95EF8|nr:PLD nuclease N-terminal domain-containing protein [Kitasatospora sp. SolWspMP-SS2h]RAJ38764.1 phospholipase D-like protein [Kitasatospora sp. SolWspMP-SS2h]
MLRVVPVVALLALWVWAFIDCLTTPEDEVRHLPKVVWVIVVLLFPLVGSIAWLVAGRDRARRRASRPSGPAAGSRSYGSAGRPLAPDDDPEFLASLGRGNERHEDMLRQWEADLRRREEELRRGEDRPEDGDRPRP